MRGDHGEVASLLANKGGKVWKASEGRLRELQESHLAGCAACCPTPGSSCATVSSSAAPQHAARGLADLSSAGGGLEMFRAHAKRRPLMCKRAKSLGPL